METDGHVDQHSSTKEAIKTISNSLLKWPFTIGVCLQNCFSMRSIKKNPTIWKKSDFFGKCPFIYLALYSDFQLCVNSYCAKALWSTIKKYGATLCVFVLFSCFNKNAE